MGFILRSALRAMMSSPRRTEAKGIDTPTHSLLMGAYAQWLHSGLGFMSTAVCLLPEQNKRAALFQRGARKPPPQQLPLTFQRPRRGAEQLRFFNGGQRSMKTSKANQAFIQVNILHRAPSTARTGCFDQEVHASARFYNKWRRG